MDRRRDNRNLQEGSYYHIYNRGNRKENIVWDDIDRSMLIQILFEKVQEHKQGLISYCIMPNHLHLLIKILDVTESIKMIRKFASKAARYYNKRYATVGHLFQDKYKHRQLNDATDLVYTSRYIHRNPLNLEGVNESNLIAYQWSSLYQYSLENPTTDQFLKKEDVLQYFKSPASYISFVTNLQRNNTLETLKSPDFLIEDIEKSVEKKIDFERF